MRITGRFMALGTAALLGLGFSTLAASADLVQAGDIDAIGFSGMATVTPAIQLVGGPDGTYSFSTSGSVLGLPGACMAVSADSDVTVGTTDADGEVGPCTLASSGTWHNIVCGTGTAGGTATVTETPDFVGPGAGKPSDVYTINYGIQFVAGIGVLVGTATEQKDATESSEVVGVVQLAAVGPCPITQFQVSGWAVSTI